MPDRVRTNARRGLRLRESPHDGDTLAVLPSGTELTVLGEDTWLRVQDADGRIGFVSADYVEPTANHRSTQLDEPKADAKTGILTYTGTAYRSEKPIRIHEDFRSVLVELGSVAEEHDLEIFVTSSLRRPGERVENAIVTPGKFSNHHVGHAIDMNLIHADTWYNSHRLADFDTLPSPVRGFLEAVRENYRWGGDFTPAPDPVHIDDGLNREKPDAFMRKLRCIWSDLA